MAQMAESYVLSLGQEKRGDKEPNWKEKALRKMLVSESDLRAAFLSESRLRMKREQRRREYFRF